MDSRLRDDISLRILTGVKAVRIFSSVARVKKTGFRQLEQLFFFSRISRIIECLPNFRSTQNIYVNSVKTNGTMQCTLASPT